MALEKVLIEAYFLPLKMRHQGKKCGTQMQEILRENISNKNQHYIRGEHS